jgi:acyl-CoA thioesterase-1
MYPRLAAAHGARLYPFFLDGVAGNRRLLQADGLHPNAQGVALIVRRMLPSVTASLKVGPAARAYP